MGGCGSGRHWHFGAKDTTDDYRTLDVRRWQREGYLEPGRRFGWQWTRDSETVASIQVRSRAKPCDPQLPAPERRRGVEKGGVSCWPRPNALHLRRHAGLVPLPG